MQRTLRFIAVGAALSLMAWGTWVWTGGPAHAAPQAASLSHTGDSGHSQALVLGATLAASVPTDRRSSGCPPERRRGSSNTGMCDWAETVPSR
jgi:hypothetical protein